MALDTTLLSRIQFAFTISFHILFPSFSIGLATFLAIMEGLFLKTGKPLYKRICKFWTKVFALTFGMGIVSGIVMEFQLGTNWSGFTNIVGPVLGSLFTYEVLTAFFIEAGFLGVMLFGWERVGRKLHYVATLLVTAGVTVSAFWILAANSWMQTPDGAVLQHGQFVVKSWFHVIFNHSTVLRFLHMLLSAYLATSLVIAGISAFYLLKKQHQRFAKKCFSFSTLVLLIIIPLQIWLGDSVGLDVHQYQPLKTAAMEGVWHTQRGAPLLLFAIPNQQQEENYLEVKIPHLASLINTHQWNGKLVGLETVSIQDQPVVPIVFYAFRIMVAIGLLMLLLGLVALYLRYNRRLHSSDRFHRIMLWCSPLGFLAILAGWFTAESGRQPWVVYHLLRTSDAASKVDLSHVIIGFSLILLVYGLIFGVFYFRYLFRIIKKGPESEEAVRQPYAYLQPKKEVDDE